MTLAREYGLSPVARALKVNYTALKHHLLASPLGQASRADRGPAGFVEVPVYDRYRLPPGAQLAGPAIVEEREATTVVGPGDVLEVDGHHNLVMAVSPA